LLRDYTNCAYVSSCPATSKRIRTVGPAVNGAPAERAPAAIAVSREDLSLTRGQLVIPVRRHQADPFVRAGPMVRIRFPPAGSPVRTRFPGSWLAPHIRGRNTTPQAPLDRTSSDPVSHGWLKRIAASNAIGTRHSSLLRVTT
jgi:hypothetical protein